MTLTKSLKTSYSTILRAKIYFFLRRSLWKYLAGMLLVAYCFPLPSFGIILSALIYFLIFILIVIIPLYYFSSKFLAHKINLDADIEFGEEIITIKHKNKQLTEVKDWNWINEILISKKMVFIVVYYPNRFLISIDKNKLSESELHFFAKKFSSLKNQ